MNHWICTEIGAKENGLSEELCDEIFVLVRDTGNSLSGDVRPSTFSGLVLGQLRPIEARQALGLEPSACRHHPTSLPYHLSPTCRRHGCAHLAGRPVIKQQLDYSLAV